MSSPTYRNTIIQNQSFGMTEGQRAQPKVNIPVRKTHRSRSTTPVPQRSLRDQPRGSNDPLPSLPSRPGGSLQDQRQESQVPGDATLVLPDAPPSAVITIPDDDAEQPSVPQLPIGLADQPPAEPAIAPEVGDIAPMTPEGLKMTPAKRTIDDVESPAEQRVSSEHQVHNVSLHEEPQHEENSNSTFNASSRRDERSFDFVLDDVDGIHLLPEGFDGSNDIYMPYAHRIYMNAYRKDKDYHGTGSSDESDADVADFRGEKTPIAPTLTRQERKALDKEIPWQTILKMDQSSIQAYVEAAQAEEKSWQQFGSVRPLTNNEARAILNDKKLRRRILRSRAAYRDKSKGAEALRAKCRVVAIDCLDPDLWTLQREAATPTRQSEFVLYAILPVRMVFFSVATPELGCCGAVTWKQHFFKVIRKSESNRSIFCHPRTGSPSWRRPFRQCFTLWRGTSMDLQMPREHGVGMWSRLFCELAMCRALWTRCCSSCTRSSMAASIQSSAQLPLCMWMTFCWHMIQGTTEIICSSCSNGEAKMS